MASSSLLLVYTSFQLPSSSINICRQGVGAADCSTHILGGGHRHGLSCWRLEQCHAPLPLAAAAMPPKRTDSSCCGIMLCGANCCAALLNSSTSTGANTPCCAVPDLLHKLYCKLEPGAQKRCLGGVTMSAHICG
jgi:hypothetical protein